jgi:glucose/arabinose dehydrogenase
MRYDENGKNGRLYSRGLRNAVGMAVEPTTGEIWVSQNERDNVEPDHEDLPPEEINILRDGGDFGWPYCYSQGGKAVPNPEYHDAARCARTIPAALEMQAHSAPLGMTFLDKATLFPAEYRSDLLVAFHGSWNRSVPTGAKVVRVRVRDGKPVSYEDFITGWQDQNGRRWGRPVDVIVYKDGSVLVSDDSNGAIYRVSR